MQNSILFTLIIPCYNASTYIYNCIDCVEKQMFDKNLFEVIFVDDCSTDNTYQILLEAKKNSSLNIRVLKNENNIGPGLTRRFAAEQALGVYLCFCDSDDWLEHNSFYELQSKIQCFSPEVIIFDMSYVLNGKILNQNLTSRFNATCKESYIINCGESLCNMCIKKDLFLSVQPIDIRHGEDLALVPLILLRAKSIVHISLPLYNYCLRSDSVSLGIIRKDAYTDMIQAFLHIVNNLTINSDINHVVEFIGIKTVLYSSTLMAIKGGNSNKVLDDIIFNFKKEFPQWNRNPYLPTLKLYKRLYLKTLYLKQWYLLRIYTWLHQHILN